MVIFVFAIGSRCVNEGTTMKVLRTNMGKIDIDNYMIKNIDIPPIEKTDDLSANIFGMVSCNNIDDNINILEYMKDGMENSSIVDYYHERHT